MLSLNSFLNQDETGLENIKFNLLVKNVPASEIPRVTEEIVDFTELGSFIQAPVRTYSTGMNARLAFAISTVMTPDILVVDEVLGVGDGYFVGKANQRMLQLCDRGRVLLYVSHSMTALRMLCDTVVWLDDGYVRRVGPMDEVVAEYEDDYRRREDLVTRTGNRERDEQLRGILQPEEFLDSDALRFRIVSEGQGRMRDTHYIRSLVVTINGVERSPRLEFTTLDDDGVDACLDIVASEWGRPHNRLGHEVRVLSPGTSRLKGGHVLVRNSSSNRGVLHDLGELGQLAPALDLKVTIESEGLNGDDGLEVECITADGTRWEPIACVGREKREDGWTRTTFEGKPCVISEAARSAGLETIIRANLPAAEIMRTFLRTQGRDTSIVSEREAFQLVVIARANRCVPCADVVLKIERSDGVYVFWQSSGIVGMNLEDFDGQCEVVFRFDENLFGHGEYHVSTFIANGWDVERNFPYSELYDRRVSNFSFRVLREHDKVDTAVLNQRVPVEVHELGSADSEPRLAQDGS